MGAVGVSVTLRVLPMPMRARLVNDLRTLVFSLARQDRTVCIADTYLAVVYLCVIVCTCFSEVTRVW